MKFLRPKIFGRSSEQTVSNPTQHGSSPSELRSHRCFHRYSTTAYYDAARNSVTFRYPTDSEPILQMAAQFHEAIHWELNSGSTGGLIERVLAESATKVATHNGEVAEGLQTIVDSYLDASTRTHEGIATYASMLMVGSAYPAAPAIIMDSLPPFYARVTQPFISKFPSFDSLLSEDMESWLSVLLSIGRVALELPQLANLNHQKCRSFDDVTQLLISTKPDERLDSIFKELTISRLLSQLAIVRQTRAKILGSPTACTREISEELRDKYTWSVVETLDRALYAWEPTLGTYTDRSTRIERANSLVEAINSIAAKHNMGFEWEIRPREPEFPQERFEAHNPTLGRPATPDRDDAYAWVSWEGVQIYLSEAAAAHRRSDQLVVHARPGFNLWGEAREVAGSNGRMHQPSQVFITFRTFGNRKPWRWIQGNNDEYALFLERECGGHYAALPEMHNISDIFVHCENSRFMWHHPWAGWHVIPARLKVDIQEWPGDKLIFFDGAPAGAFERELLNLAAAGSFVFFRVGIMGNKAYATIARHLESDEWFFATTTQVQFHRIADSLKENKAKFLTGDDVWSDPRVNEWDWPLLWTGISWRYFEDANIPPDQVGVLKTAAAKLGT